LPGEPLRLDPEPGLPAVLLRRDAQGPVLSVRVDDDARHLVPEQLLDQDPEKVALASARLREDADVALNELVDVELDPQVVVPKEADVRPAVRMALEAQDLRDERLLCPVDARSGPERDGGTLDDALIVAVADNPSYAQQALVDGRLVGGDHRPCAFELEVALPLEVVQLAQDVAVHLVLHGEIVPALDRVDEDEVELAQSYIAEDAADLFH